MAWEKRLELGAEYQTWRTASGYCCFVRRWRLKPWIKKQNDTRPDWILLLFLPLVMLRTPRFQTCPRSSNQNMTRSSYFRLHVTARRMARIRSIKTLVCKDAFCWTIGGSKGTPNRDMGEGGKSLRHEKTPTMKCTVTSVRTARKRANETTSCTAQKGRRRIWRHHHGFGVHFSPLWTI